MMFKSSKPCILALLLVFVVTTGGTTVSADDEITALMKLWDFYEPAETEQKFVALIDEAKQSDNTEYLPALLSQIARTYSLRREFDSSHERLDEAESHLDNSMFTARTLVLLERGRAYNSDGKKDKALPLFRDAFYVADAAGLEDLSVDAAHMIAIAETGEKMKRWNLIAMAIAETSEDPNASRWLGSLYNNQGWTYFDEGDYNAALNLFEKGVKFRKDRGQTREWQIARWTVARTYRAQNRLDDAYKIQVKLLDEVGDDTMQLGYIHEELGELLLLNDDPAHTSHFAKAYEILSEDAWLQKNELDRLVRLKDLGSAARE